MRNVIAIQRGLILAPDAAAAAHDSAQLAASLQAELMNLGFMLDGPAFAAASKAPRDWLVAYHGEVIPHLRKQLGANRSYQPFYRNFPAQVMAMSDLELFINAYVHYLSDGTWEPPQILRDRGFAFENVQFKPIRLGTEDDLKGTFTKLVSINQSLTEQDKATVAWLVDTYGSALPMPDVIPFKETLCMLAAKGLDVPVKTPTDVLRIAVHLSGGDISLPGVPKPPKKQEPRGGVMGWLVGETAFIESVFKAQVAARKKFQFKRFRRPQRRLILTLLEKTNPNAAEMQRHLGRWLRLGEILHVGEHATRFPRSAEAFQKLRNQRKGTKVRTFAARVDLAFKDDWRKGVDLLATRPGEFARRLDWMLRTFERGYVLETFGRVASDVSSKVLFELYDHFAQRYKQGAPRVVMLKGRGAKMKTLPPLPAMDADLVQQVGNAILAVIRRRIAALPPLGKVWVDDRLKQVPVPFAMRSVNTAVRTYVRGTRVPFRREAKVVRPFIHWFDEDRTQDLDLSVGFYDATLKQVAHVSFTHLKAEALNSCHSGTSGTAKGRAPSTSTSTSHVASARAYGTRSSRPSTTTPGRCTP